MTTDPASLGDDPRRLLSTTRELTKRVRRDQRATWFPLLVLAALTFVSVFVRRYGGHHLNCHNVRAARNCLVYSDAQFIYWPIALVLAYVVIVVFYVRRTQATGVGTRIRPYAIAGVIIAIGVTALALWQFHDPRAAQNQWGPVDLPYRLTSPAMAIGLALLVLARVERNRALLLFTLAYLVLVIVPIPSQQFQAHPAWYSLPAVVQGGVLLLVGLGFALAQRPLRTPAS